MMWRSGQVRWVTGVEVEWIGWHNSVLRCRQDYVSCGVGLKFNKDWSIGDSRFE